MLRRIVLAPGVTFDILCAGIGLYLLIGVTWTLTYIIMDNEVYGMTKGQASSTTAPDWEQSKLTPHGTGIRPFKPAGLALSAGASFIARGFSGDPNGLARMLVEAIEHPGFSFLQVLSPCPTYCPEQMLWKKQVRGFGDECTDDPILAAQRIQADDGMSTGIIFKRDYAVFESRVGTGTDLDTIEREFVI